MAIILPNYTTDETVLLAELARKEIEQTPLGEKNIRMSASFGVAALPEHAQTSDELLKQADIALYQAKKLGRNLVRVSGEPDALPNRPRLVERKEPSVSRLSDQEARDVHHMYFTAGASICPRDKATLRISESHQVGYRTPHLLVQCPLCGLQERILGTPND